ncbi:MAG TPA: DUF6587 family protein [Thermomonas sp.]|nr:DUF6587 family protein [Thermomonas sp.]
MGAGLLAQYLVIALVVMASIAMLMRSQFPAATRRLRIAIALRLLRDGSPAWMRSLGRRIAPVARGGGNSCGGCDSCD